MKYLVWILLILVYVRCESKKENKEVKYAVINQELPSKSDIIDLSKNLKISNVIVLESSDSSIIDFVHKVVEDDFYFIQGGRSIYKFDKSGNYISKISKAKGGPDEFVNLTDILLLNDQNRLWLYDSHNRTIFQYDYDFNLEINYTLDYPLFGLEKLNHGIIGTPGYMMVNEDPYSLFYFKGENLVTGYKFEKTMHPFDIEKSDYLHVFRHDFFSKLEGGDYNFVNSFNDTIYNIKGTGEISPSYFVDFGNKKLLEADLVGKGYTSIVDVFQFINSTDKSFNVGNIFESQKLLIYRFFNQGNAFLSVYNKMSKSLISGHKLLIEYSGRKIEINLDEEIRIGSLGDGRGYIALPSESSVLGDFQKVFGVNDGDNPIILIFNEI